MRISCATLKTFVLMTNFSKKLILTFCLHLLAMGFVAAEKPIEIAPPTDESFNDLTTQLGDPSWDKREAAQSKLYLHGVQHVDQLMPNLLQAYLDYSDPEVRVRLKEVVRKLAIKHYFDERRAYLGLRAFPTRWPIQLGDQLVYPLRVRMVKNDNTADLGNLMIGDLIIKADDHFLTWAFGFRQFHSHIALKKPADTMDLTVLRDEDQITITVTLGEMPQSKEMAESVGERQAIWFENWFRSQIDKRLKR